MHGMHWLLICIIVHTGNRKHSLFLEKPSCVQTTLASTPLQRSSHTVPQAPLLQSSTRPWLGLAPVPANLRSPVVQAGEKIYRSHEPASV